MMCCDSRKKLHFNDVQALRIDGCEVWRAKFYHLNFLSASGICRPGSFEPLSLRIFLNTSKGNVVSMSRASYKFP
jgi:hypothetical protein